MQALIESHHEFELELRLEADPLAAPIRASFADGLDALLEEAWVRALLGDRLESDAASFTARVEPLWSEPPFVRGLGVALVDAHGVETAFEFDAQAWTRTATALARRPSSRAATPESEIDAASDGRARWRARLVAERRAKHERRRHSGWLAPAIEPGTLDELGVRDFASADFEPDRPVLIAAHVHDEIVELTERAGEREIGGVLLGKCVRLAEPLRGATTRVATVFTAALVDQRSRGESGRFDFAPEALLEAALVADARGRGEAPLSVFHSHGWGCGDCNQVPCRIPRCDVISADDYVVVESLLAGKAALFPVAGRKPGASGRRPVLVVHAWSGGVMRPIRWAVYRERNAHRETCDVLR
jgi:hypothetical protein